MPTLTLSEAQTKLDLWLAANDAIASGQSYSIGSRTLTRVDAAVIQNEIRYWSRVVDTITAKNAGNKNAGVRTPKWA